MATKIYKFNKFNQTEKFVRFCIEINIESSYIDIIHDGGCECYVAVFTHLTNHTKLLEYISLLNYEEE